MHFAILQDDTFRQISLRSHHRARFKFNVVIAITPRLRSFNIFLQLRDIAAVYLSSIDSSTARNNGLYIVN